MYTSSQNKKLLDNMYIYFKLISSYIVSNAKRRINFILFMISHVHIVYVAQIVK